MTTNQKTKIPINLNKFILFLLIVISSIILKENVLIHLILSGVITALFVNSSITYYLKKNYNSFLKAKSDKSNSLFDEKKTITDNELAKKEKEFNSLYKFYSKKAKIFLIALLLLLIPFSLSLNFFYQTNLIWFKSLFFTTLIFTFFKIEKHKQIEEALIKKIIK